MLAVTQKGLGQLVAGVKGRDAREGSGVRRILTGTQLGLGPGESAARSRSKPKATQAQIVPSKIVGEADAADPVRSTRRGLESVKVVMATGLYKTAAGLVGQRALKENAEALRAYLCVCLRDSAGASKALVDLEQAVEQGGSAEMAKGPTKRSGLFLAARNVVEYERLFGDGQTERPSSAVPWEPTPPGRIDGWGRALDEVRYGLSDGELEILMLRHGAGLELEELAYVLGAPRDEVDRRLEAGLGYIRFLLEDVFGESPPKMEEVLRDAFRVEPPTAAEVEAARPKVVPLPAGTLLGDRYEIEAKLGGGEFAYVYRARDVRVPGHVVALKLLHRRATTPAGREGAIRELSLIASAFHPSIVQFKDHGWFEDRLWFVMPFYEGEMLLDRIERGPLPLGEALAHFERLARGLAALHAAGIRHQDIKPENIFLVELRTGRDAENPEVLPILLDLGVAAPDGEMALAGTPMYFPPEVAARIFDDAADVPLTAKADVFALALSLLHSIEEPDMSELDGVEVEEFLRRRASGSPAGPVDRRHAFLEDAFARWLAPDPTQRPTAGELADELREIRLQRDPRARTFTPPKRLVRLLTALALVGLVLCAALLVDAPMRHLEVHRGAPPVAPVSDSEQARLLERRLDEEAQRAVELEEELSRLRRLELGLEGSDHAPED